MEEITANLMLQPTKVKRKGEPITSKQAMKDDYQSYKVEFDETDLEMALDSFLNDFNPSNDYIRSIATKQNVYILFSLRSRGTE